MRKNLLTLAPLSLLLLSMTGEVQAGTNATIDITGNIVAASCDVSTSVRSLDLGNYSAADFTAPSVPIPKSESQFTVMLSNCGLLNSAAGTAALKVKGITLAGHPDIFNSSGTNAGVMLRLASEDGNYIKSGEEKKFTRPDPIDGKVNFTDQKLTFMAAVASSQSPEHVSTGDIIAPIMFQLVYN